MVDPGRGSSGRERVAKQETAAAADFEETVVRPERERVEDRSPRPLVNVLGAVDLLRAAAARPAGDTVGQPVDELGVAEPARLPCRDVLVAEPERSERLLVRVGPLHGGPSYGAFRQDALS